MMRKGMKGLSLYLDFIFSSLMEVRKSKALFFNSYIALFLLANAESFLPFLGVSEESNIYIVFTIVQMLIGFVVLSQIVLLEKQKRGGSGELLFFVPTYLLYNLYYSFLFFIGLIAFIVPGLYVLVFFSMGPLIAVLDDEAHDNIFKRSRLLVSRNVSLVAWGSGINFLFELKVLLFSTIKEPIIKATLNFILSIPESLITILMTMAMVKIYYHLKDAVTD